MIRIPRVAALLGVVTLEAVDVGALQRLVDRATPEDFDLEYKQATYDNAEKGLNELAVDVASLANLRGGVLIIGIREDPDAGTAAELTLVDATDDELGRIRHTVASRVFPLPELDVVPVHVDGTRGFILVVIGRSPTAPHGVRFNGHNFRYPVRYGTTTRYLQESEIADAYRSRFRGEQSQRQRLDDVVADGSARVAPALPGIAKGQSAAGTHLAVGLAPNVGGNVEMNRGALAEFHRWVDALQSETLPYSYLHKSGPQPVPGFRRIHYSEAGGTARAKIFHSELHLDGAGFFSAMVSWWEPQKFDAVNKIGISEAQMTWETATALHLLGRFAVEIAGCWGDAAVSIQLVGASASIMVLKEPEALKLSAGSPLQPTTVPASLHTIALEDLAEVDKPLFSATRLFLTDLVGAFGLPEPKYIDPDGRLAVERFQEALQSTVAGWAPLAAWAHAATKQE